MSQLPELLQDYPCLWDKMDCNFADRTIKKKCLLELLNRVNQNSVVRISFEDLKRKVRLHNRKLKKIVSSYVRTCQERSADDKPRLIITITDNSNNTIIKQEADDPHLEGVECLDADQDLDHDLNHETKNKTESQNNHKEHEAVTPDTDQDLDHDLKINHETKNNKESQNNHKELEAVKPDTSVSTTNNLESLKINSIGSDHDSYAQVPSPASSERTLPSPTPPPSKKQKQTDDVRESCGSGRCGRDIDVLNTLNEFIEYEKEKDNLQHIREMTRIKQADKLLNVMDKIANVFVGLAPSIKNFLERDEACGEDS